MPPVGSRDVQLDMCDETEKPEFSLKVAPLKSVSAPTFGGRPILYLICLAGDRDPARATGHHDGVLSIRWRWATAVAVVAAASAAGVEALAAIRSGLG